MFTQSAFAVYVIEGEFLFDGKDLLISGAQLKGMVDSEIQDSKGFDYSEDEMYGKPMLVKVGSGQTGSLQQAIKKKRLTLLKECSNGNYTIKVYDGEYGRDGAISVTVKNGATYYRPTNPREGKGGHYHIESITNFGNRLEMSMVRAEKEAVEIERLSCK